MAKKKIQVLIVEPMEKPRLATVDHKLEEFQKIVDGYIQAVYPFNDEAALICNEESKLNGKQLNRLVFNSDGRHYDVICGTFFICGLGYEDFTSLTDDQAKKYSEMCCEPEFFLPTTDRHLVMIKANCNPVIVH